IDSLASWPASSAEPLRLASDPQQRTLVALQQSLEKDALLALVLGNTLEGRRPGAPLTELQTKLLARIEDPAMRGLLRLRLAIQDGPLSRLAGHEIDAALSSPAFSPTESALLNAIEDPAQRAKQAVEIRGRKQALLGAVLAGSLDGRKPLAPLTE